MNVRISPIQETPNVDWSKQMKLAHDGGGTTIATDQQIFGFYGMRILMERSDIDICMSSFRRFSGKMAHERR